MDNLNIQPNSYKSKQNGKEATTERKKVEKVVSGKAITKKKSGVRKLVDIFISEDAGIVKDYIISDAIIPTVKKLFCDIIKDSADIIFGGGSLRGKKSSIGSNYISYDRFSDRRDSSRHDDYKRYGFEYDDIILESKGDAEEVLMQLDALIETYGHATVADLYDMVGKSGPYTLQRYGWTSLRNARSERVREGYLLKLPRACVIER